MLQWPKLILTALLLLTFSSAAYSQLIYNLNKDNGLATDHVYITLVDKKGYLWIGTTNGLYRYNGYTLTRYDYKDGLPNTDIWGLHEDKQGRIWPKHIAQQMGYIKDHVYKKVYKNTGKLLDEVYAHKYYEKGDSLIFINITTSNFKWNEIGIVKNDTLYARAIRTNRGNLTRSFWMFDNYAVMVEDSNFYVHDLYKWLNTLYPAQPVPSDSVHKDYDIQNTIRKERRGIPFADKYFVYYGILHNKLFFFNIHDFTITALPIGTAQDVNDESIGYVYNEEDNIYVLTNKGIMIVDANINCVFRSTYKDLLGTNNFDNYNNTFFLSNAFWGQIFSTNNKGLFIKHSNDSPFKQSGIDLSGYRYINAKNDSVGYWWNNNEHILSEVLNGSFIHSIYLPDVFKVTKIVGIRQNESILISEQKTYWLGGSHHLQSISEYVDELNDNDILFLARERDISEYIVLNDAIRADDSSFIGVGTAMSGSARFSYNDKNTKLYIHNLDSKRYKHIVSNASGNIIICYTSDKILFTKNNFRNSTFLDQSTLLSLGVRGIEQIAIDSSGNVFIKDYDRLHLFNVYTLTHRTLFKRYNLVNAKFCLLNDKFILAGNFGVLLTTVTGINETGKSQLYPNHKSIYYNTVQDLQGGEEGVLINTDNGAYIIDTKTAPFEAQPHNDFRVVLGTSAGLKNIAPGDTLSIEQYTKTIYTDIIKPTGTGNLTISYAFNNSAYHTSAQQMILPDLKPGIYNTVSIKAADDAWISEPFTFYIYSSPHWWQKPLARNMLYAALILIIAGLIYLIVRITQKVVNDNNNRRNQRREVALKSIYSQINPHFIFNTLSTAQYFVKKNKNKQAYDHINQFSDLLRAYIKSSRNKYISIKEEIENLENYLELQLNRFEDKFDYTINADNTLDMNLAKIPSLLLQPLVENALNHGIFHLEGKGLLQISFMRDSQNKDTLICIVEDNGVGRKKAKELRGGMLKKADSYGNILIKELISTFNKYERININLEYIDKEYPESGTIVIIHIKNYTYA